jgi:Spy/CpxP family protein refolding chaperone
MKRVLVASLLVLLIFPAALATGHDFVRGPGSRGTFWASLSYRQREQIRELHRRFLAETAPLSGSFLAKRVELRALWSDPRADAAAIEANEREVADLWLQIQEKAVKYRLQARSLMTPEQISLFQGGRWLFHAPGVSEGGGPEMEGRGVPGYGWGTWRYPRR